MDIAEKILRAKADLDEVYEAGKASCYDTFWDKYQDYGNRYWYDYAFAGDYWDDETFKPKYPPAVLDGNRMFCHSRITYVPKIIADSCMCGSLFEGSIVKTVGEFEIPYGFDEDDYDGSKTFKYANYLENITIRGEMNCSVSFESCPHLSRESIESIIASLSDKTTGKTLTLNISAVDCAFETIEGNEDGEASEEWAALVATKPNWTISMI